MLTPLPPDKNSAQKNFPHQAEVEFFYTKSSGPANATGKSPNAEDFAGQAFQPVKNFPANLHFITLSVFVALLLPQTIFPQCTTAIYGQSPASAYTPVCDGNYHNITSAGLAGEYSEVNVVIGVTYTFKSSVATDYITISNSNGTSVNATGVGTATWLSVITGTVRFYTHTNSGCGSLPVIRTRSVKCGVLFNPCASITSIPACGSTVTANLNLVGGVWLFGACGSLTLGQELIYSFTAPATGSYTLNVVGSAGGTVDFFWRQATSGCDSLGWNCIGAFNNSGSYTALSFSAGTEYYILLDPEFILPAAISFNMVCPPPVFLPVQLTNFDVRAENKYAKVGWSTFAELNNDYFSVERSTDGLQFDLVASVDGAGNSSVQKDYSIVDEDPVEGNSYYRIGQTDINGGVSYSGLKSLNFHRRESALIQICPNPGRKDEMRFQLSANENAPVVIILKDLSGRELFSVNSQKGQALELLNETNLQGGTYLVVLQINNEVVTRRIILTD
jgi:hypothetical protein